MLLDLKINKAVQQINFLGKNLTQGHFKFKNLIIKYRNIYTVYYII